MADPGADRAYVAGLTLLARRELAEAQLRARLVKQKFAADEVDAAVERLRGERALDDRRTALACARTEVQLRRHGRMRVVRRVEALGIASDIAREAVAEVFTDLDEGELLEQALERRLRPGTGLDDPAAVRRLYRYLIGQGFEASAIARLLRRRGAQMT